MGKRKRNSDKNNSEKKQKKLKIVDPVNVDDSSNFNNNNNNNAVDFIENKSSFSILKIFPAEVWWPILTRLTLKEVSNLSKTSRFFYQKISVFLNDYSFLKNQFNKLLQKTMITVGNGNTFIRSITGDVWGCGCNLCGQLGVGDKRNRWEPEKLSIESVDQIAAGTNHTFFRRKDGKIFSCGNNSEGQLGTGNRIHLSQPTEIPLSCSVQEVIAGIRMTIIIDEKRNAWGCGNNFHGQLGLESIESIESFSQLPIESVKHVAFTERATLFVCDKGKLTSFSLNNQKKLEFLHSQTPKKIVFMIGWGSVFFQNEDESWHSISLDMLGNPYLGCIFKLPSIKFPEAASIKEIYQGGEATFFLLHNGEVWACGPNGIGQLGLGHKITMIQPQQVRIKTGSVAQVIPGVSHTLFLLNDGRIFGCGGNIYGGLGLGKDQVQLTPVELPKFTKLLGLNDLYKKIEAKVNADIKEMDQQSTDNSEKKQNSFEMN